MSTSQPCAEPLLHTDGRAYAPIAKRILAGTLDIVLIVVVQAPMLALATGCLPYHSHDLGPQDISVILGPVLGAVLGAYLYIVLTMSSKRRATLGMRALGLEIVDFRGGRIPMRVASLRYIVAWLSVVALGTGYLVALLNKRGLTFHDMIADTYVVERA